MEGKIRAFLSDINIIINVFSEQEIIKTVANIHSNRTKVTSRRKKIKKKKFQILLLPHIPLFLFGLTLVCLGNCLLSLGEFSVSST